MSISVVARNADPAPAVIENLEQALRETIVETAKAQTYHWNVTGMAFGPLHALFQEIYEDHFAAQDTLAKLIKALGSHADGRLIKAIEASKISECDGAISSTQMIENLARDQRLLSSTLRQIASISEEQEDIVTADFAIERAAAHDNFAWMLAAHLEG